MTTPVISKENYFAFVMPYSYDENTIPKPNNKKVKIEVQPEKKLAVLRFSGRTNLDKTNKRYKQLLNLIVH